jgi:hypothetical protein
MGLGWHVALEKPLSGVQPPALDGKALIHRQRDLDEMARKLSLEPLTHFVSVNPDAVGRYLEQQGLDPASYPIPDEEWFAPADGLQSVRGLLSALKNAPEAVLDSFRIVRDLQAIEQILTAAEREQVQFHLSSDMPALM